MRNITFKHPKGMRLVFFFQESANIWDPVCLVVRWFDLPDRFGLTKMIISQTALPEHAWFKNLTSNFMSNSSKHLP